MHPTLEEICRAHCPIRPEVFRRWQRELRDVVQPLIDAGEQAQVSETKAKRIKPEAA